VERCKRTVLEKVLILKPRLDVMFKKGPVPQERGPIEPIRVHWEKFVDKLAFNEESKGNNVHVLELPNWQFTPELIDAIQPTKTYIPHKQAHQFPVPECYGPRYYMQMVFPWLFQIDKQGWGPDASVWPIRPEEGHPDVYSILAQRNIKGESKFPQPDRDKAFDHKGYVFFPCQIPHDETIRFHSNVSVAEALTETIDYCKERDIELIIKGHPVNPGSMTELREIGKDYLWADDVNINTLLHQCSVCVMVNSGVGMEAILHGKPVVVHGDSDYASVVYNVSAERPFSTCMDCAMADRPDLVRYRDFINTYHDTMFDSR
jgi:hypothetical protein